MSEFISDILREATIEEKGFDYIDKIILNAGNYTEEQKKTFIFELQQVLFDQYANLTMVDLSKLDLDERALRTFFRLAGTSNIKVNSDSDFYEFLQRKTDLSDVTKKRLGLNEEASNQEVYDVISKAKLTSFSSAIIPAKDLLKLDEFMDLNLANIYHISVNDEQDVAALAELKGKIQYKGQKIFVREGIELETGALKEFQVIGNVKTGEVTLSKEEELFHSGNTSNQAYRNGKAKQELASDELTLCVMNNICIPARALALIANETLEGLIQITLSVETEEDKSILEEYREQGLQGKKVSLVASTAKKMPPELLEGLDIGRVMIGTDENKNGKYKLEDYQKIYRELEILTKGIEANSSDYDKFQIIYERLAKRLKYDYKAYKGSKQYDPEYSKQAGVNSTMDPSVEREASRLANLEALLYDGQSVCSGFSETLRQTLSMVGIEAHVIIGDSEGETHAWNRVKLDGKLYNCDLTWDENIVNSYGIYKKARPRRILRNNPSLSKKIMPHYYLKGDKTFSKDHTAYTEPEGEALEDFDADKYYQKDFRRFLKDIFSNVSTRLCQTSGVIMQGDISNWERGRNTKEVESDDRSL